MDLEFPPHTVTVTPRKSTLKDDSGTTIPTKNAPVIITGAMLPLSSKEERTRGLSIDTGFKFLTKSVWVGGPVSTVLWNGRTLKQHGEARTFDFGSPTDHTVVYLSTKSAEVK